MGNQNLFAQSYNEILAKVVKGSTEKFQMVGNPMNFNWPVAANGQISPQAYQIMSAQPKYSEVGSFDFGDASFFDSYKQVFNVLTFKVSPENQNNLNMLQNEVQKAENDKQSILTNAKTDYESQLQSNGKGAMAAMYGDSSFETFLKKCSYAKKFQKASETCQIRQDALDDLKVQLTTDNSYKDILRVIKTPSRKISGASPKGWTKVKNSAGDLEWRPVYNISTSGQDWRTQLAAGTAGGFTVQLDASNSNTTFDKSWAGGNAKVDYTFWAFGGNGSWEKSNITENDKSVKIEVSAKSSTVVPVDAGLWYDGGFMRKLAKNIDGTGFKLQDSWNVLGDTPGSKAVFGQYGLLSCRVRALVVVHKLSFKVTMDSSTFSKYHQKFQASAGLRIGPFRFGGTGGHESTMKTSVENGTTFIGEDTSDDPQIIGVLLSFPGLDTV